MGQPAIAGTPTTTSGTGTTPSLTKITGLADGDSVVIVLGTNEATSNTVTWPTGFSQVHASRVDVGASDMRLLVGLKHNVTAASEPATWDVTMTSADYQAVAIAVRPGNGNYLATDTTNTKTASASDSESTPAVTTTDKAWVLSAVGGNDTLLDWPITLSGGTGWSTRLNQQITFGEAGVGCRSKQVTSAASSGSYTTDTGGNTIDWTFFTIGLIDVALPGGGIGTGVGSFPQSVIPS